MILQAVQVVTILEHSYHKPKFKFSLLGNTLRRESVFQAGGNTGQS